ncbi:hypothetical protein OS493_038796 [Desmophyllum pertusum]|uniref:Uncharacterized protein n=1 Tax=Desmophyllum pertusum TaxID=174260 RepID=A0A9W9YXB6_9CNID|nr:hypothetical protein OS493_038796 [Desmophyllum pertusum]
MDCHWNITSNAVLELVFLRFNSEKCCDYVRVYNGGSLSSPAIGSFSGSSLPAPITSSSNNLYVRFASDGSVTSQGFRARYRGVERGKIDIQQVGDHCEYVSFSSSFSSGTPVRVFASINHGNRSSTVHDTAFVWVEDVTTSRFKACLVQGGQGAGGNTTIDWFAFQGSQSGVYQGEASFTLFTTGTKCSRVAFPQAFSSVPKVHVTVKHATPNQKQDAMSVWIANVSTSTQFEVCLRESRTFDGPHSNIAVNWLAYEDYPSSWEAKESSEVTFSNNEVPAAENNYALCKNVSFTNPFYAPPVVLTTVINGGSNNANIACPLKDPLSSWLEEVTNSYFRVCIKDDAGYDGQRGTIIVDYLVIGDYNECNDFSYDCPVNATCVNSDGSYSCRCPVGYRLDGKKNCTGL